MSDSPDLTATLRRLGVDDVSEIPVDATLISNKVEYKVEPGAAARAPGARRWQASLPNLSIAVADAGVSDDSAGEEGPELEIEATLGEGGMGKVYLVHQRSLQRRIAVKTVRAPAPPELTDALCWEAVITGNLEHPGIVPVHALGRGEDGAPLLLMKRVEGVSWRALLRDDAHPAWAGKDAEASNRLDWHLGVLAQVAHAVAFAHSRGYVHRDIKPENVMVGDFGEVYVVDWGLALSIRDAAQTELVGTPAYMAPELATGGAVDERTDVYLLGATLHEILTGAPPHDAGSLPEALERAARSAPAEYASEVPAELAGLCRQAMQPDPAQRVPGAAPFRARVLDYQRHRVSRALSRAAELELAALRAKLRAPKAERNPAALQRSIWECRFGYAAARREWADNPDVTPGLQACLEAAIQLELEQRNPAAARAIQAELPEPRAAVEEAIRKLEDALARDEAEQRRLRELARDVDDSVDVRHRLPLLAAGLVVAGSITVYALTRTRTGALTTLDLVLFACVLNGAVAAAVGAFGRRLLAQGFNRRLVLWAGSLGAGLLLNRLAGLPSGDVTRVLMHDLAIMGTGFLAGAIFIGPRLLAGAVVFAAAAIASGIWPHATVALFSGSGAVAFASVIAAVFAGRRSAARAER